MNYLVEVRIDLNAIQFNLDQIRSKIGTGKPVMAMIKADAYGHGAVELAQFYERNGVMDFGVAHLSEARILRDAGIKGRILVFQPGFLTDPNDYVEWDLEAVINHVNDLDCLAENVRCHLMIDTGLCREGVLPEDVLPLLEKLQNKKHINLVGACTHFAQSDEPGRACTIRQLRIFDDLLQSIPQDLRARLTIHAANSGAIINFKEAHYDMVRPGILLYGLYAGFGQISQRAAMSIHAKLVNVKKVGKGSAIGYGGTFKISEPTLVGVLSLGYADGFSRGLSNKGKVWRENESFDILGRVSMDQVVINLNNHDDFQLGTEFLIWGGDIESPSSLFQDADSLKTITYERACQLGMRLPKVYLKED